MSTNFTQQQGLINLFKQRQSLPLNKNISKHSKQSSKNIIDKFKKSANPNTNYKPNNNPIKFKTTKNSPEKLIAYRNTNHQKGIMSIGGELMLKRNLKLPLENKKNPMMTNNLNINQNPIQNFKDNSSQKDNPNQKEKTKINIKDDIMKKKLLQIKVKKNQKLNKNNNSYSLNNSITNNNITMNNLCNFIQYQSSRYVKKTKSKIKQDVNIKNNNNNNHIYNQAPNSYRQLTKRSTSKYEDELCTQNIKYYGNTCKYINLINNCVSPLPVNSNNQNQGGKGQKFQQQSQQNTNKIQKPNNNIFKTISVKKGVFNNKNNGNNNKVTTSTKINCSNSTSTNKNNKSNMTNYNQNNNNINKSKVFILNNNNSILKNNFFFSSTTNSIYKSKQKIKIPNFHFDFKINSKTSCPSKQTSRKHSKEKSSQNSLNQNIFKRIISSGRMTSAHSNGGSNNLVKKNISPLACIKNKYNNLILNKNDKKNITINKYRTSKIFNSASNSKEHSKSKEIDKTKEKIKNNNNKQNNKYGSSGNGNITELKKSKESQILNLKNQNLIIGKGKKINGGGWGVPLEKKNGPNLSGLCLSLNTNINNINKESNIIESNKIFSINKIKTEKFISKKNKISGKEIKVKSNSPIKNTKHINNLSSGILNQYSEIRKKFTLIKELSPIINGQKIDGELKKTTCKKENKENNENKENIENIEKKIKEKEHSKEKTKSNIEETKNQIKNNSKKYDKDLSISENEDDSLFIYVNNNIDNNYQNNHNNFETNNNDNGNINNLNDSTSSKYSSIKEVQKAVQYKKDMEIISFYIKNFYSRNKKYPNTKMKFYKYGRLLGKGAFGKVNLSLHTLTGRLVAIKTINKEKITTERQKQKIKTETFIMKTLSKSNNIVKFFESFETKKHICIVMEYICAGDLLSYIKKRGKLSEPVAKYIFKQIILALKYIHSHDIVHRDIKLDNILLDLDNNIKICDFGVSKIVKTGDVMFDQCGTPAYIAPEILENKGYEGFGVDVWSAGVVLYAMLSGNVPFKGNNIQELHELIMTGKYNPITNISKEAEHLINSIFEKNPKKRISTDDILVHPWLIDVDLNYWKNQNLFTNAEYILLAKSNVDYRKMENQDDMIENFDIRNIDTVDENLNKNINTKSFILAPFNSSFTDNNNIKNDELAFFNEFLISKNNLDNNSKDKSITDFNNPDLHILNDIIKFDKRVKELDRNYELNNNQEIDNGIVISPNDSEDKKNVKENNNNLIYNNNEISPNYNGGSYGSKPISKPFSPNNELEDTNPNSCRDKLIKNNFGNSINNDKDDIVNKKAIEILEELGYKKTFVKECLEKNCFNYATTSYNLIVKYGYS